MNRLSRFYPMARVQSRGFADSALSSKVFGAVKLKSGDVLVQNNADSEFGKAVIQLAKDKNIITVNVIADKPGSADAVEELKRLGGDIVVTESYAGTWYLKRLLSNLPAPSAALTTSVSSEAVTVAKLLKKGGTLLTLDKKLPDLIAYPGSHRRPLGWADFLKSKNITAKQI